MHKTQQPEDEQIKCTFTTIIYKEHLNCPFSTHSKIPKTHLHENCLSFTKSSKTI